MTNARMAAGLRARIFASEFDDLAAVVAQNISVEIRPGPEVSVLGVLKRLSGGLGARRSAAVGLARVGQVVLGYVSVRREIAARIRVGLLTCSFVAPPA